MKSPLEQFDILNVKNFFGGLNDFSYNNILLPFLFVVLLFSLYFYFILFKKAKIIPLIYQYLIEMDYRFIINIIKQQTGLKGIFWTPLIFVIFNFILFSNLLSLIPFGIALTSHLIVIL